MTSPDNPFKHFIERYGAPAGQYGPELLAQEVFGFKLDDWQIETARAKARGEQYITIAACHGPGKTFLIALLVVHQIICLFPQKCAITAPSKGQLEDALEAEVKSILAKLPPELYELFTIKKNRIELANPLAKDESFVSFRTAREENPEALQGVHCDAGWVLLVADEASGVHEKIFQSAGGSMSQQRACTILASNPTRTTGLFFDSHNKPGVREKWFRVHVTGKKGTPGYYSPRVDPSWVEQMSRQYGENSNAFRIRVLGQFPAVDDDTVIPYGWAESARKREIVVPHLPETWGLDVARFGSDSTALARRNRLAVLPNIMQWHGLDLMETVGRVKEEYDKLPDFRRPRDIMVDVIGMGGGVVDRGREVGLPMRGINVAESASSKDRFRNLRTELWWMVREWLETKTHKLPECTCNDHECVHEQLFAQLVAPRYKIMSGGKIWVEPKDEMKKRLPLMGSPNLADAVILTFAREPASLIHGKAGNNWNEPIKRNISHV